MSKKALTNENYSAANIILEIATLDPETCFPKMHSSRGGLGSDEVNKLRASYGYNEIAQEKAPSWPAQLVHAFINPFTGILLAIIIISIVTNIFFSTRSERDYSTVVIIFCIVLLSSLLRFWQEYASNKAAQKLKAMITTRADVLRKGKEKQEVDIRELVPGDVILLSAGDMIPADCRIIESKDLFVSQSAITGESMPAEKTGHPITDTGGKTVFELDNICFMGTNIVSGSATALAIVTDNKTYLGAISRELSGTEAETSFDKGVNSVSWLLVKFMMVMVPLIFLINLFTKGDWLNALLFAIAVAVGLTPEMLPMIVTVNLARGAMRMSRKKVIVKRLNAIQNLGAMDVLCTDKTGTLTMDQIVLERYVNIYGVEDKDILKWAFLNSYYQTGLKNLMDMAVLEHKEWEDHLHVESEYKKIDEIPFDFERRRMSVVLERPGGDHILITKGAAEEMLAICTSVIEPGENRLIEIDKDRVTPITDGIRADITNICRGMNEQGLRVLSIAVKKSGNRPATYNVADENDMTLAGFIGFLDPAKPSARQAIETLESMGIKVKVLTGDNAIVARKICGDVDIPVGNIISGKELDALDDNTFAEKVEGIDIFAKLSPAQKGRIIKALQAKGHTVGFLGDGINDAGALKMADVGISVDSATDVAKESADIILLEKDLAVLGNGVIFGRQTFGNIIKYIKMAASSNFGNMFSMLGASALLPFLPVLPIQLLFQNLLYDFSQVSIPWDRMDKDYLATPRKWEAKGLARFMMIIGPISSVFDYVTFGVLYYIFKANTPATQSIFQSGWFVESLISQTLIVHLIRTRKIPFVQSTASLPVLLLTGIVMLAALYIPFSPLAGILKFTPLPGIYFLWLSGILLMYCVAVQVVKMWYIKAYNQWL
jgi:P-type Mg2+ transporter